jgi:hypothetical protein
MQQKQEESLNDIQLKLAEITKIKDHLKATNEFKPNLSSLNQNASYLFGSIRSYGYSDISFKSEILTDERQMTELIDLCEFSPSDKWTLLYCGSRDGFGSRDSHSKCDGHLNTLTILKAKQTSFIFGGFTSVSWDSSNQYKSDPNAFIFSLTNKHNQPVKMNVYPNEHESAILCHSKYGPTFGKGADIRIANNSNTTIECDANLGDSYKHPRYEKVTNEARTFLAGSHRFQLVEIEVYQKE